MKTEVNWHWLETAPDNMPPQGEEVFGYHPEWVDKEYNPQGTCLCFWTQEPGEAEPTWVIARWDNPSTEWAIRYGPPPVLWTLKPPPPRL